MLTSFELRVIGERCREAKPIVDILMTWVDKTGGNYCILEDRDRFLVSAFRRDIPALLDTVQALRELLGDTQIWHSDGEEYVLRREIEEALK